MLILHYSTVLGDVVVIDKTENELQLKLRLPSEVKVKCKATLHGNMLTTYFGDIELDPEDISNIDKFFKT